MDILRIVLGSALLLFGRKLFWLFVGIAGFLVGLELANRFFGNLPDWQLAVIALVIGFIAALGAVLLQRVAVAIAGFLIGGYIFTALLQLFRVDLGTLNWLPYLLGGVIGAILVSVLFDWALIILSSLAGATMIVEGLALVQPLATVVLVILLVVGIALQAGINRRTRRPVPE